MQGNWARWQQPNGGLCNYNLQIQNFHCSVAPRTPQPQTNNISWEQQLQQAYIRLIAQSQSLLQQYSSSYGQFGSTQVFNSTVTSSQNYTGFNNCSSYQTTTTQTNKIVTRFPSDINLETMEPKDFVILTRFNAYAINFRNTNAISEDQVYEIFSVYGKIKRVKQTGDEHGLCFVNFENEEDALKAAAGVKNHPDIRLRPAKFNRPKNGSGNNSNEDNGNNFSNGNGDDNNSNGNGRRNYSNGNGDNSNGNGRRNYSNGNRKNNYSNDNLSNSNETSKTDCFNEPDDKIVELTNDKLLVPTSEFNDQIKTTEKEPEVSDYNNKQSDETFEKFDTPSTIKPAPVNNDNEKRDQRSKSEIQIPDLVEKIYKMSMVNSRESVDSLIPLIPIQKMAVEVVVGNIPEGINVHGILQLFNKHLPLAATDIMIYKPSLMKYCRVYFTSQKRAEDVEAEFHNCVLMDKQLIVMRASSLVN